MAAPGVDWASIEQQAIQEAMPYLMALIGLAGASLIAFGTIVLNRLKNKMAAEEAVSKDALMKSVSNQGIHAAEELSAQAMKDTGKPLTGQQKENIATGIVQASIPDTAHADATTSVLAALGAAPSVGASGKPEGKP